MSNEIANQLLVRVQNEMAHNITTVKKQLIEWLERPESGGVDAFAEQLSEVSGGLALLNRNNAAQLCTVLADSVKTLDDKYRDKTVQESEFSEIGAEIASGLLLLNDYITRLSFVEPTDERLLNEAAQAIESILAGNGIAAITVQPKIDRETYQALSAKVTEVLETSRNQIEQYGVHANKQFDVTSVIGHNKNLISLFEVLDLKAPQLLLKQINQMLGEQLSESQWIDIAEAMILVEETLKHAQSEAEDVADYRSAITEQSTYSRSLEIQKLLRDTGEVARQFYESLRKSLTNIETVSTEQPWKEAALRTSHFASIAHLVGEKHLSAALNQLSLQFAEISLQTSANADAYPAAIDVLIAAEYIFNDLSDTAKINHSDVDYLKQVSDALNTFYKPSNQAKSLLLDFIKHEEKLEEAQVKNEDADLANGLDDLLDGLDALDSHFDGSLAEIEEDAESDQEEELPSAVAITGQANEDQAAAGAYQAYFAGKSLNELSTLSVPAGKENFLESHDSAVMDDEIREFFLEELAEKIQEIRDELDPWQANPYEQEHIGVVRRAFHTIKGSGRTVGYEALGECAWQHEQMLNRVIDKTFDVNATIQNLIADTVELLRILTVGEDFVEHQPALLMQASLAEHITNYLSEHKDADEQVLAQYANSVRAALTDDAKHAPQIIEKITEKLTVVEKQTPLSDLSSAESNIIGEATNTVATAATIPVSGDFSTVDEKPVSSDVSPKTDSVSDISFADENDLIRTAENSSADAAVEEEPAQTFSLDFADTERSEEASAIADLSVHSNEKAGEDSGISLDVDTKAISDNVSQQTKGEDAFVERSASSDISAISLDAEESEADFLADDISATVAQGQSSTLSDNVEHKEEIQAANTYAFGQPFYADKTLADLDNISSVGDKNVVPDQDQQAVDQDILEIFLEELDTTVEQIDQTLSQWKNAPQDKGLVEEVRRAFHTIKGSGKMVGYQDLGDFAWQYEHLLNSIAESYFPTNDLVLNAVADANDLLKILRTEDGFNEHKASLSLQGQVAHQAREHLIASPEMSFAEQANLARNLYAQFAAKSNSAETASQDAVHADLQIDKVTAAEEDTISQTALHADVDLFADDQHSISQPIDANISTSIDDFSREQRGSQSSTVSVTQTLESAAVASPQSVAQKTQASDDAFEPAATEQKVVSPAAYDEAIVEKLAKEVSAVIGHGLHSIDIHDEDDKSLLRDMVSARISQQEHSLSSEQMASLSAQVSTQLAGKVTIGDLSEILPASALGAQDSAAPTISASVSHIVASLEAVAYRHIADMLQRSLAAQPLDEDDEAILAQQLDKEFSRLGHSLDDAKERAELQAQLSAAFSGSAADNPAYEKLLSNVLSKAAENALSDDNVRLDDAVMQRLVATVSRMSAMQTDSDDVEILRQQIQSAIAKHTADIAQQEVLEASVASALKENFAQESAASALLDEVFADEYDSVSIQTSAATEVAENVIEDKLLNTEVPLALSVEESQAVSFSETEESNDAITDFFADADNAEVQFADSVAENEAHEMVDALISEIESQSEASLTDEVNAGLSKDDKQGAASVNEMDADDKALMDEMLRNVAQELAAEPTAFSDTASETSFDDMLKNSAESHDEIASSSAQHISAGQNVTRAKADKVDYVDSRSGDIVFNSSASSATGIAGMTPSLSSANAPKANAHSVSRLSDELSKISAHPSLENAVGAKESEQHPSSGLGKFLNAVDKFESLSQQVEDNNTPEMLDNLIESVYDIEDSIEAGSVPDWIWRMLDAIEQLLLAHRSQGSGISLSAASILRQSIDLIEHFDDNGAEDAAQTINSLMQTRKELGVSSAHMTREIVPIATSASVSQNWDEWIPDPNHGTELAETFLDEAVLLLGRSQLEAERWDQNRGSITHLDAIRRDMHTLKGGARMSGYLALGDLTHAIESMIESLVDGHSEANNQAVAVLSGALWQAMIMLDAVRDGFLPQTDPYMLNNINRFLNLPLPYPEVAEQELRLREAQAEEELSKENAASVQEAAVSAAEEIHEAEEMATAFDENIDPILVDIFTDEAQELIDQAEALFAQDLKNEAVVEELKRNMHTLKGAARLVGLTAIGDTSHLMESLIEQLADYNETKMRQAKNLLNMGHEALYSMLDSVLRKEMPIPAKSLNESLTIFAKEGRFVQPNAEAPAAAVESATSDETPVAKQTQAEQHPPVQVSDTASSAAVEQAQDAAPSASSENDAKAEKLAESPQESAQKDDAASSSIAKEAAAESSIAQEADKPQAAQEKSHAAEAEKPEAPKPISSAPEAAKPDTAPAEVQRYVRVDADLLDEMIAMVGETAIMRSRLENVSSESTFNLNELTRIANRIDEQMRRLDNETEAQMLFRREAQTNDDEHFDPLEMDRFTEIQQLSRQLSEAINDLKNVQETLAHENALIRNISIQQGFIQRGIQDRLLTTQLVRFDVNEARLKRLVRQTAKSVDKDIELIIEGGHVELERRLIEDVLPAIEHMIRNSVGHGIETPAERKAAGKPAQGIVKLTVAAKSSNVEIRILDDGRGFDYDRIREKARSKGWLDESRAQDQHYLNTLMMRSGFSTAQAVTQLSGRGVGMDVVNEMVKQRRGQLIAESIPGKGAQFTILMPFTMSISEVLLVEVAEQTYAVPMSAVAAIAQVPREDLQRSHAGEEVYIQYDGMDYRLYMLGDYFKSDEYQFAIDSATAPALFINASGEPTAFYVDRVANRVEVIVKNVNRQVLNIPGISGATILGDGNVIPVLEPLDLARRIGSLSQYHSSASAEEAFVPNILVVDDSVTMRKVSTRLLERNGYIVESAKDGLDAIDVLQRFTPDLILLDIEMPRMDGFEFASHVRQNSQVSEVPIIMITSRTGDKHRERADQIGIQGYLGKPYREDILIETIESLLGDKANG